MAVAEGGWKELQPVKELRRRATGRRAASHPGSAGRRKSPAIGGSPRAVDSAVAEVVRGGGEEEAFRRSSLTVRSPNNAVRGEARMERTRKRDSPPYGGGLMPVVRVERLEIPASDGTMRASTPFNNSEEVEVLDDTLVVVEPSLDAGKGGETDGASSTVLAPPGATKRGRSMVSSESELSPTSITGDEGSATSAGYKQRRKRGRPRTTNIIDAIREKERAREEERRKEREDWEERRMADPNLVIPPSAGLPSLVVGELENQPTPDITSELMQVVRTIEKVATTAKNLKGTYVSMLRSAALKVHAGLNVLAHRSEMEKRGDDEEVSNLRRKVNGLRLDKERTEREMEEATRSRREAERERLQREIRDLRGRMRGLEEELLEIKGRCIAEMDGGDRRAGRGGDTPSPARPSPPPVRLSPVAGVAGVRASPAKTGGRLAPPHPAGGTDLGPSLLLLQQMEGVIDRIVEQVAARIGGGTPRTVVTDPLADFDHLPAPEAPIPGTSGAGGGPEKPKKKKKKKKKKGSTAPSLEYFGREVETDQPSEKKRKEEEESRPTWATVVGRRREPGRSAPSRPSQPPGGPGGPPGAGRGGGGGALPPVRRGGPPLPRLPSRPLMGPTLMSCAGQGRA